MIVSPSKSSSLRAYTYYFVIGVQARNDIELENLPNKPNRAS
jgi:hypothetical protein